VSSDEQVRLAALERTLVAAAERQAQRRRRRRRRAVVLAAVAAPLTLAAAGSVAATGFFASTDRHLSALRDERLEASAHATTWIAGAAGKQPRDAEGRRTWLVGGHRVTGFTAADGSFCFRFAGGAGGCLAEPGLSLATPVTAMSDNAPGTLRVYGLAMDGVTAVSLRTRGVTRRAAMGRNAFYLEANALGNRKGFTGTLIVRYGDGTTRLVPLRIGGYERRTAKLPPRLPGLVPVGDTAA
jgi:hypothetical protein